jgi:hypothetical protein
MDHTSKIRTLEEQITKQERLIHYLASRGDAAAAQQAEGLSERLEELQQELAALRTQAEAPVAATNDAWAPAAVKAVPRATPEQRLNLLHSSLERTIRPMLAEMSEKRRAALEQEANALEERLATLTPESSDFEAVEEDGRDLRKRLNVMRVLNMQARAMAEQVQKQHEELLAMVPATGVNKSMQIGLRMLNTDVGRLMNEAENATTEQALTALAPFAGNIYGRINAVKDALTVPPASERPEESNKRKPSNTGWIVFGGIALIALALWVFLPRENRTPSYAAIAVAAVLLLLNVRSMVTRR